jgi:hypothetical protein
MGGSIFLHFPPKRKKLNIFLHFPFSIKK